MQRPQDSTVTPLAARSPQQTPAEPTASACDSCAGTGEYPSDYGIVDCPDCGGAGYLPPRHTLVDWRTRDIERANEAGLRVTAPDIRWLLAEVRQAREALRKIVALAHDATLETGVANQIRLAAEATLGETSRRRVDAESGRR